MTRQQALLGALALVLACSAWLALQPDESDVEVVAAAQPRRATPSLPATSAAAATSATSASAPPRAASAAERMPWVAPAPEALLAWSAPAPPPAARPKPAPAAAVPAAPEAPPLPVFPYRWIGQLTDEQGATVTLLASAQRSLGARTGDVLDGNWRIKAVADDRVDITWLPTGSDVTLNKR